MGVIKLFSSGSDSNKESRGLVHFSDNDTNNPPKFVSVDDANYVDIYNYKVLNCFIKGEWTVLKLNFPNCKSYGGDKLILLKDFKLSELDPKKFDPHFLPDNKIFARFIPTQEGMAEALDYIEYQINKKKKK